jgi:hypothetical protein
MAAKQPRSDEEKAKAHAGRVLADRRVTDIFRIRLDGADWRDLREFVRAKEAEPGSAWFLEGDATAMSDAQIRRYAQKADNEILQLGKADRKRDRRRHIAQRKSLYARAVVTGDLRTALAVLQDEATLLALYPDKRVRSGDGKGGEVVTTIETILPPEVADEIEDVVSDDAGPGDGTA